jgi:hypothetical protein
MVQTRSSWSLVFSSGSIWSFCSTILLWIYGTGVLWKFEGSREGLCFSKLYKYLGHCLYKAFWCDIKWFLSLLQQSHLKVASIIVSTFDQIYNGEVSKTVQICSNSSLLPIYSGRREKIWYQHWSFHLQIITSSDDDMNGRNFALT